MSSSVEQIKAKIDIVSLVGSYVKLEKAGTNFKGKCPFHHEKTPSFFVSPDRGSYYCFGCHAKGDIFTFVQEFEGLDFIGALKVLADRAGVRLERENREEKSDKERLQSVLEQATFFYQKCLSEHAPALDYLKGRGVTDATISNFRIGYAPAEWRSLHDFLSSKKISISDMLAVGLVKRKEGSSQLTSSDVYDTFRGRIMFPISDSSGRVVGFSGRILVADDKAPKYVNSPETVLFSKSDILFGLDKAKKEIRIKDYSILVEGQMDLVMMHQAGLTNTVASSGTALTAEHLTKLNRLSSRIIMAFDGDPAGFAAADRSAKLALSLGMELKIAALPAGSDPADLVKDSPATLVECLKQSKHIIDFYTDELLARKLAPRQLGTEIRTKVLPYVALLSSAIEKAQFIQSISKKAFIKEDALWEDLKHAVSAVLDQPSSAQASSRDPAGSPPIIGRADSIERRVIGVLLWQEAAEKPLVDLGPLRTRVESLLGDRLALLVAQFEKEKEPLLFETEAYYNGSVRFPQEVEELLNALEEEYLKKKFAETMILLQQAEQQRDSAQILQYLELCQQISQRINTLKHEKK